MKFVSTLLRTEGLAIGAAAIWLYFAETELSWVWLAVLFLAPDLAFVAVVFGKSAATKAYNLAHSYVAPVALGVFALAGDGELLLGLALIWFAHIGVDRLAGYGLKYSLQPKSTHLQRAGQPASAAIPEGSTPTGPAVTA